MRTAFDFTPYRRSMIGFDRLFDMLEKNTQAAGEGYPPYDIERVADDRFRIAVAVAGFSAGEVDVTSHNATLIVTGRKTDDAAERQWLHRGIAARAFERRFELADFVQVKSAELKDGLLVIELQREVPEAMKPRRIEIGGSARAAPVEIEAHANQNGSAAVAA